MQVIIFGSILITISATPWINSDALIIPKIILLSCLAAFFIPELIRERKTLVKDQVFKLQFLLSLLFILQMTLVIIISDSPYEQELYGKTGRGLGFLTYLSLLIVMIYVSLKVKIIDLSKIALGIMLSCIISSLYSIAQFYGFDFFDWRTQTNGIIGTIGNPNFQSSFVAIAFIPSVVYIWSKKYRIFLTLIVVGILLFTLYICESTQGYVALASSILVFILLHLWYKRKKLLFNSLTIFSFFAGSTVIAGMLDKGPLSYYLYKVSVRSRGEMWQTAISVIKDNPLFGVGIDSLGDYSLMYRSLKTANGIDEYIDNCHNFILQFAATGGIWLATLYVGLIVLTIYSFIKIQSRIAKFDYFLAALFAGWVSFQLQSFISPAAIPTMIWNFIFCGVFIGLSRKTNLETFSVTNHPGDKTSLIKKTPQKNTFNLLNLVSLSLALILTYPLFYSDKISREANIKKDASLAVKAAKTFPESIMRYNRLGADLFESGLYDLSLEIGRSAVKFNPNSYQTWIIVLVNPSATVQERLIAKEQLMKIDPYNRLISEYVIQK